MAQPIHKKIVFIDDEIKLEVISEQWAADIFRRLAAFESRLKYPTYLWEPTREEHLARMQGLTFTPFEYAQMIETHERHDALIVRDDADDLGGMC